MPFVLNSKRYRAKVEIIVAEPNGQVRLALRNALYNEGYEGVRAVRRRADLEEVLTTGLPDFILSDLSLEDGDTLDLFTDLRHARIGRNPYVPLVMTCADPSPDTVRRIIDCGVDAVLLKPISPDHVLDRIQSLSLNRKAFVVTSNYIGPDRRRDPARGSKVKSFEVPNTLGAKIQGKPLDQASLDRMILEANADINEQKIRRNAYQLSFLVGLIQPDDIKGELSLDQRRQLADLQACCEDHMARIPGTRFKGGMDLCKTLMNVSSALLNGYEAPKKKDVKLLKPVTDAILLACNEGMEIDDLAKEISGAIETYKSRVEGRA